MREKELERLGDFELVHDVVEECDMVCICPFPFRGRCRGMSVVSFVIYAEVYEDDCGALLVVQTTIVTQGGWKERRSKIPPCSAC